VRRRRKPSSPPSPLRFELRAALSLARLYRSTGRAADAYAVLAPALQGFAATPEFPEIAEAQGLLAALAETDEVKNAAEARLRRLKLQTDYGQALLWARGHAMPETKAAFARARELARQVDNAADRFSVYYGQWVSSFTRGEIGPAREMAELFLHDVEADPSLPEACVGHRVFGSTCWYIGEFAKAHEHLQRALNLFDPKQHQDFMHRFGQDVGSQAGIFDALALYGLGHVDEALHRADQAGKNASITAHVPTLVQLHYWT
jgi:tetratricopeptide (TPR) repeat protein